MKEPHTVLETPYEIRTADRDEWEEAMALAWEVSVRGIYGYV